MERNKGGSESTLYIIRGRGTLQSSAAGSPPEAVSVYHTVMHVWLQSNLKTLSIPSHMLAASSTDLRPVIRFCLTSLEELLSCCSVSLDRGVLPFVQRGLDPYKCW